jgi:hypothetical protein
MDREEISIKNHGRSNRGMEGRERIGAVEVESFSRQPWLATVGIHALKK